jgi:hypothetical protein
MDPDRLPGRRGQNIQEAGNLGVIAVIAPAFLLACGTSTRVVHPQDA